MKFARGRQPPPDPLREGLAEDGGLPNRQCGDCDKIYMGTHADLQPGRQVSYLDENGVYADEEEAKAAGIDTTHEHEGTKLERFHFTRDHGFSHGLCEACSDKRHAEHLARREEKLRQQEQEAQGGGTPPDEDGV